MSMLSLTVFPTPRFESPLGRSKSEASEGTTHRSWQDQPLWRRAWSPAARLAPGGDCLPVGPATRLEYIHTKRGIGRRVSDHHSQETLNPSDPSTVEGSGHGSVASKRGRKYWSRHSTGASRHLLPLHICVL
jgi:hypothetical protein